MEAMLTPCPRSYGSPEPIGEKHRGIRYSCEFCVCVCHDDDDDDVQTTALHTDTFFF